MNFQILDAMFARKLHLHPELASTAYVDAWLANGETHEHDDLYYTEDEIDALLADKSDVAHEHDQRYYTETEIDNMIANLANGNPVSCFKAVAEAAIPQALAATTYLKVNFSDLVYQHNSPEFSLSNNWHKPTDSDIFGLWHYDVGIRVADAVQIFVAVVENSGNTFIAHVGDDAGRVSLSFDYVWSSSGKSLEVQVWAAIATTIDNQGFNCYFNGHRVGPVS